MHAQLICCVMENKNIFQYSFFAYVHAYNKFFVRAQKIYTQKHKTFFVRASFIENLAKKCYTRIQKLSREKQNIDYTSVSSIHVGKKI